MYHLDLRPNDRVQVDTHSGGKVYCRRVLAIEFTLLDEETGETTKLDWYKLQEILCRGDVVATCRAPDYLVWRGRKRAA